MKKDRQVIVFGPFGCGHLSVDAALSAMLASIRTLSPATSIVCVAENPAGVVQRIPVRMLSAAPLAPNAFLDFADTLLLRIPRTALLVVRAVATLRRAGLLFVPGVHLFDDFSAAHRCTPFALLVWTLAARALGVRIALVGVAAGHSVGPVRRRLLWAITRQADFRSFRDAGSKSVVGGIGIDVRDDRITPDLLFKIDMHRPAASRATDGAALTVGVDVVSRANWPADQGNYDAYLEKLASVVHWLLDRSLVVRLLKGDATEDDVISSLSRAVLERRFGQGRERLRTDPAASLDQLLDQIVETDIVLASHHHVAAGALKLGRPTLSIGLSDATSALLVEMGFPALSQRIGSFDVAAVVDQFTRIVVDRKAYERAVVEMTTDFSRRLADEDARLAELLRPVAPG
ncbi:MAG: polysaccharide pyruvyl transferase family protein [Hyphomicrobium sp.]